MRPESDFTAPHEYAPHPEWWHAEDGEATEEEVCEFIGALVRLLQPSYVVETGSHVGRTSVQIALALQRNGHGHGVSLEIDPERVRAARSLVQGALVGSWVEVREQSSLEFTPEQNIDLLFCDSLYELRSQEIQKYHAWLVPGRSVIAIHDWTSGIRGHYRDVRADVEEMAAKRLLTPIYLPTPRGLVLATVPNR